MKRTAPGHKSVFFLLLWCGMLCVPAWAETFEELLAGRIEGLSSDAATLSVPWTLAGEVPLHSSLERFYRLRTFRPAWVSDSLEQERAQGLLDMLRDAGEEGLCPEDFFLEAIEPLVERRDDFRLRSGSLVNEMARLDMLLTNAALLYASHLIHGRVDPEVAHSGWRARLREVDLAKLLAYAVENNRLEAVVGDLVPPHAGYRKLREKLRFYRLISALGGMPQVPSGTVMRPGGRDARVALLRDRLFWEGDLLEWPDAEDEVFDPQTVAALVRFQRRHGLDSDGVLGPKTLAALRVPVEERIRQIEINMERWRWLPKSLGRRYLSVNIADFSLQVVEDGAVVMAMPVVVGTGYRKTPVFSAYMSYLEFAPYWHVPPTILREDKLPKIKADPDWLQRHHFQVVRGNNGEEPLDPGLFDWAEVEAKNFPGVLRQKPGSWNPLGQVKFMFPNQYAVYLHDTNDRRLFRREVRLFSSGCIRIERPLDLAQYLLESQGWGCGEILDAAMLPDTRRVTLERQLPVHIQYWTAWVDDGGDMHFRPDIYQRDLDLHLALGKLRQREGETPYNYARVDP